MLTTSVRGQDTYVPLQTTLRHIADVEAPPKLLSENELQEWEFESTSGSESEELRAFPRLKQFAKVFGFVILAAAALCCLFVLLQRLSKTASSEDAPEAHETWYSNSFVAPYAAEVSEVANELLVSGDEETASLLDLVVPSNNTNDEKLMSLLPLPACSCHGYGGKSGAYKQGAKSTDSLLCMSPWGEPHGQQSCYPTSSLGACAPTMQKCNNTAVYETVDVQEVEEKPSGADFNDTATEGPCLCAFDIDRTLTAKQGSTHQCDGTSPMDSYDWAFGGGQLTLSALSTTGVANTACAACYVGVTSRGTARGKTQVDMEKNRAALLKAITTKPFAELAEKHPDALKWSAGNRGWDKSFSKLGYGPGRIHSPLVVWQLDRTKQWAIEGVLQWYASKGVQIARNRVFFFDDRADNALYFNGTGMNAHQISCSSRAAGNVGHCGARPEEITLTRGVRACTTNSTKGPAGSAKSRKGHKGQR